jgi:hypothetical protein
MSPLTRESPGIHSSDAARMTQEQAALPSGGEKAEVPSGLSGEQVSHRCPAGHTAVFKKDT